MENILFGYVTAINGLGICLMGIDKYKARKNLWRIPERTLFLTALLGGSIGILIGMYLFHHKTRKLRFAIGIPAVVVLQFFVMVFFFHLQQEQLSSPSAAVATELEQIQNLDETTIQNFVSYESLMNTPPTSANVGSETIQAVHLFFENFQYQILSEETDGQTAVVSVQITNNDAKALAQDVCLTLTARNLALTSDSQIPESLNDYFAVLYDTLQNNTYEQTVTTAYFHLKKLNNSWKILADETLQDELVSGFISYVNDPDLLSAEAVLSIYMDEFSNLSAPEWIDYLKIHDIFSVGSDTYASAIDHAYLEKITASFDYTIEDCISDGSIAYADLSITSIDMSQILATYKEKLLSYAHTSDSITSTAEALADASALYLLESLEAADQSVTLPVTVTLSKDGSTWQLEITDDLINAFLGNINDAIETFSAEALPE